VEALAKTAEGLEAGWVDDDVAVGLLVFPVLILVSFVSCSAVGANGCDAHGVWVAAGNIDKVVGHVFAAEGDDIES
jgi:hypothetical protein